MKKFFTVVFFTTLAFIFLAFLPQDPQLQPGDQLAEGYYIVVAAYRKAEEDYARWYMEKLNKGGLHSTYGYDPTRQWLYVYLDYYTNFNESIQEMLKARKQAGFDRAWVRVMPKLETETKSVAVEEVKEEKATKEVSELKEPVAELPKTNEQVPEKEVKSDRVAIVLGENEAAKEEAPVDNPKPEPVYVPQLLSNTQVFLSLFNGRNNKVIQGDVEVIDTDRSRLITKVKGNDYLMLPDPKSKSETITLLCNVFGYRKVQHEISYTKTESDTLKPFMHLVGNYYMIDFDLVRLHKGDIETLYNVYFYNDAAIMLPESKYELNNLLQMMEENPKCRIMLHGHTNGNAHGQLITMGPSKNYFALTDDVKKGAGSAKDLSRERAATIREWMIDNGIDGSRVEVKAWGGSRMIHDKRSVNAKKNVRVEVEVLED